MICKHFIILIINITLHERNDKQIVNAGCWLTIIILFCYPPTIQSILLQQQTPGKIQKMAQPNFVTLKDVTTNASFHLTSLQIKLHKIRNSKQVTDDSMTQIYCRITINDVTSLLIKISTCSLFIIQTHSLLTFSYRDYNR